MTEKISLLEKLKARVKQLKRETFALYFAYGDKRLPWYAKAFTAYVVARTFSPIDLIPDFIPVLGYLDDLILTPLGIYLALKMIPPEVMLEARRKADEHLADGKPVKWGYAAFVILVWVTVVALIGWVIYRAVTKS
jgi:uncharacterized membrane protein YkvA (DUF1232 family)